MTAEGRPAPTSSGQLARTPLPHLLVYAHDRQLTGTFTFRAVWTAIREQPPFEHVKAALERMTRGRLRIAKTAQLERFGFTNEERRWIDLLRVRPMRLDDLFAAAEQINERITRLIVYCLAITKQIDLVNEE